MYGINPFDAPQKMLSILRYLTKKIGHFFQFVKTFQDLSEWNQPLNIYTFSFTKQDNFVSHGEIRFAAPVENPLKMCHRVPDEYSK